MLMIKALVDQSGFKQRSKPIMSTMEYGFIVGIDFNCYKRSYGNKGLERGVGRSEKTH